MNNDIKEILEKINKQIELHLKDGYTVDMMVVNELDVLQWRELLDYITNLQVENYRLKKSMLEKQFPDLNAIQVRIKTEKYRIEKAIEYLHHFDSDEICENITGIAKILLNILEGRDDYGKN